MSTSTPAFAESLVTNTHGRQYWIYTDDVFYQQRIANAGPYQKKNLIRLRDLKPNARTIIDVGANIGMNLKALNLLHPGIDVHAIEINAEAAQHLGALIPPAHVYNTSILDFAPTRQWDLCLIKGVLIHINPDMLPQVYDKLVTSTARYLMVAEYYNPVPVAIPYRGHSDRLFKRDFAGEILERYPHMQLVDYGFAYRRDPNFPQDDITWFLMERR